MRKFISLVVLAVSSALPSAASSMSLSFSWAGVSNCSSTPPAFSVSGAPAGTAKLAFDLVDNDAPNFKHGGGTVASKGGKIPAGSFSYVGPCPPGVPHTYTWTVRALDANGKELATARASGKFSPK